MIKYRSAMEKIQVDAEMERRVLTRLEQAARKPFNFRVRPQWRQPLSIAACLVLVVSLALGLPMLKNINQPGATPPVQAVNRYVVADSVEALKESLTYELWLPSALPKGYSAIRLISSGSFAEVVYKLDNSTICIRMSPGEGQKISGDYTVYERVETLTVGSAEVVLSINGGDGVELAEWSADGFSFSLNFSEGLSISDVKAIIESVEPA